MPAPGTVIDLVKLFENTFGGKPYVIPGQTVDSSTIDGEQYKIDVSKSDQLSTPKGSIIQEQYRGVEIWLPVRLYLSEPQASIAYLPYSVIRISGKKYIVRTPMAERRGTVKEQYGIEDYSISIKGFLIGENKQFPEKEIDNLKQVYEAGIAVKLDNALTNIFLTGTKISQQEQQRVVILDVDMPEVQGGRKHVRPFTMQLESDSVFTLELE